jgi:hypothetical protein
MCRRGSPSAAPAPPYKEERQLPTRMAVSAAAVLGGYAPRAGRRVQSSSAIAQGASRSIPQFLCALPVSSALRRCAEFSSLAIALTDPVRDPADGRDSSDQFLREARDQEQVRTRRGAGRWPRSGRRLTAFHPDIRSRLWLPWVSGTPSSRIAAISWLPPRIASAKDPRECSTSCTRFPVQSWT